MKYRLLSLAACLLLLNSCKKSDSDSPSGGSCASDATICFRLGDSTYSFKGHWSPILGGGRGFGYDDSVISFGMDVGSSDKRTFAMSIGSLWSGGARMTWYNKKTHVEYKAHRGNVIITATDNDIISGTFEGAVRNTANSKDTLTLSAGTFTKVEKK